MQQLIGPNQIRVAVEAFPDVNDICCQGQKVMHFNAAGPSFRVNVKMISAKCGIIKSACMFT